MPIACNRLDSFRFAVAVLLIVGIATILTFFLKLDNLLSTCNVAVDYFNKGTLMNRPRHHTLQGICQDVCVNYQQVVEVHRRIRDVVLKENGTVITHEIGTFFCRDVKPRSGVLNGVPWESEGFFEVGLRGERSVRSDSHSVPEVERVTFLLESGGFVDSVLNDLFSPRPVVLLDFTNGMPVIVTRGSLFQPSLPIDETDIIERSNVPAEGLDEGFNNVQIEILESDNSGLFRFESLRDAEALLVVGGERIAMGGSFLLDISSPVPLSIDPSAIAFRPQANGFRYRLSYTYFGG